MSLPRPDANTGHNDPARIAALILSVMVLVALIATALWFEFHRQIAVGVLAMGGAELRIISWFTHDYDQTLANLQDADPERVSAATLWTLCTLTGGFFRWPAMGLIAGLAVLCLLRAPRERYREQFGLPGLQKALARIHPIGKAWIGVELPLIRPADPDTALRPMDPALRLSEWQARHLGETKGPARTNAAERALVRQLGGPWRGPENAKPIEICLFMVFALQADRMKTEALELLAVLSSALSGHLNKGAPTEAIPLPPRFVRFLRRKLAGQRWDTARQMTAGHAFSRPALLTLLQHARVRSGVMNPGLFSTVQLVDRELWLVLAAASYPRDRMPLSMMSTAACIEAHAALEHWQAESGAGTPLEEPSIRRSLIAATIEEN
ncbi:hypothetical protein HLH33_09875 [Gluconacetobacter diazotrophicus]|uniref:DotM C-terminal cytoplasmic domain-containing protein n=1 Tax=Gluconacetobacter diazotrophicus TaxID=33996 RepID=A0A7W4FF81_GLUDI|nr:hypothetical protein [Gluconacetobacter diazotrophicus]MBB2156612.1 hypothetical protein [Gluconacetobacter diazotrophicus]